MISNIAKEYATKGGPGSGFSDPRCRRGIPGQRGGSVNVCKPGGIAQAMALGIDVSDMDLSSSSLIEPLESKPKVKTEHINKIQKVVQERIDEPDRITRRQIISQELQLPISVFKRDQVYDDWSRSPYSAPDMWEAASRIQGISYDDIKHMSHKVPKPGSRYDFDIDDLANSIAADVEISREAWNPDTTLYRGLKIRPEMQKEWDDVIPWIKSIQRSEPDATFLLPNNFLESWTTQENTAREFAGAWRPGSNNSGVILSRQPERDNIFLDYSAIRNYSDEQEVILSNRSAYQPFRIGDIEVIDV